MRHCVASSAPFSMRSVRAALAAIPARVLPIPMRILLLSSLVSSLIAAIAFVSPGDASAAGTAARKRQAAVSKAGKKAPTPAPAASLRAPTLSLPGEASAQPVRLAAQPAAAAVASEAPAPVTAAVAAPVASPVAATGPAETQAGGASAAPAAMARAVSAPTAAEQRTAAGAPGPAVTQPTPNDTGFRIGPEDVLDISVWREDALQKELLVRPDGGVSFPLIGEITAAGKSPGQLRDEITERLRKFIPDPSVNVSVLKVASQKVYVMGKVNKPGEYVVGRYVDVLQALAMAGGLTPFAEESRIRIIRRGYDQGEQVLPFDYGRVQRGTALEQNVRLQAGDTIVVP